MRDGFEGQEVTCPRPEQGCASISTYQAKLHLQTTAAQATTI